MTTPNQDDKRSVRTLADLRALSEAATPAPWSVKQNWLELGVPDDSQALRYSGGAGHLGEIYMHYDTKGNNGHLIAAMRNALPALLDEVEALREQVLAGRQAAEDAAALRKAIADVLALAEDWRYKGEFGWGAWQEGEGPDQEGWTLDHCSRAIRRAIAPDAPASEAHGRPLHSSSTEQED